MHSGSALSRGKVSVDLGSYERGPSVRARASCRLQLEVAVEEAIRFVTDPKAPVSRGGEA